MVVNDTPMRQQHQQQPDMKDVDGITLARTFTGQDSCVRAVAYAPCMKQAFSGANDGSVMLWNFRPQHRAYRMRGHKRAVTSISVSPNEKYVVSGSEDHTIRIWEPSVRGKSLSMQGHMGQVLSVQISDCSGMLLSAGSDKMVKLWDMTSLDKGKRPNFLWCIRAHNNWARSAQLSKGSSRVVSGGDDKLVKLWDTKTCQELGKFADHNKPIKTVRFDPITGSCIASGSEDGTINLWDSRSKQIIQHYSLKQVASINCVCFHPSGNYLMSASADAAIRIWDLREGRLLYTIGAHTKSVNACEFSSNGQHFLSGSTDSTVLAWNSPGLIETHSSESTAATPPKAPQSHQQENSPFGSVDYEGFSPAATPDSCQSGLGSMAQKAARASMARKQKASLSGSVQTPDRSPTTDSVGTPTDAALKHIAQAVRNLDQRLRMNEDAVAEIQHNQSFQSQ